MRQYTLAYKMHKHGEVKRIVSIANKKFDAYLQASFWDIPEKEGGHPYSAWVEAVTYNNGNYQVFNTFEGQPV